MMTRRMFLDASAIIAASAFLPRSAVADVSSPKLGVGQYSFNAMFSSGELSAQRFPKYVHDNIPVNAIEWASVLLPDPERKTSYREIKSACDNYGIKSHAILVDGPALCVSNATERNSAIDYCKPWIETAHTLDCKYLRVNAWGAMGIQISNLLSRFSADSEETVQHACAESIDRLLEAMEGSGITLLVENHMDYSSRAIWLAQLMELVADERCRVMLDFGNWLYFGRAMEPRFEDPYEGCRILAPYTASVSAKSRAFDAIGNEVNVDYARLAEILASADYSGYYVAEYESFSSNTATLDGVNKTLSLLERVLTV